MELFNLLAICFTSYFLSTHAHVFFGKKYPGSLFKQLFKRYVSILLEIILHYWCAYMIHPLYLIPATLHLIYMIFFEHTAQEKYIRADKSIYCDNDRWYTTVSKIAFIMMDLTVFMNTLYVLHNTTYFYAAFIVGGVVYMTRWVD